jgi:diguanylate cyclase (GGDEF)-like protein/PAS domain S-box-containing protein
LLLSSIFERNQAFIVTDLKKGRRFMPARSHFCLTRLLYFQSNLAGLSLSRSRGHSNKEAFWLINKLQIKWHNLYYLLAAFDILAVSGSLYLNHQIMMIYSHSVELNQTWASRVTLLSELAELAIEVNAPGNNVFDDGDVTHHKFLRDDAHRRYLDKVEHLKTDISSIQNTLVRAEFSFRLARINAAMDAMLHEANQIFHLFETRKGVEAGSRMATMDRKAALLLNQIGDFTQHIQGIQKINFEEQLTNAADLRRYEHTIALIIGMMVVMVTIYGHKLARQMRLTQQEREATLADLKKQSTTIEQNERRLSTILDSVSDGIIIVNSDGTIDDMNPAAELQFNYLAGQVRGRHINNLIPEIPQLPGSSDPLEETTLQHASTKLEFVAKKSTGEQFVIDLSLSRFEHAEERKYTCVVRDITTYKQYQEKIKDLAMKDSLTGLFNRNSFNTYFKSTLERNQANDNLTALMVIYTDRFKFINDTYGHHVGDSLLIQASERMQTIFRNNDLIARLGGDEFAIVLGDIIDSKQVDILSQRLVDGFKEPFYINSIRIETGISVGISLSPTDDTDAEALMRKCDLALYSVKKSGRGNFSFFNSSMQDRAIAEKTLEQEMKTALANNEFELFYQPQIDVGSNAICGVEALIRWNHPQRGMISPDQFIAVAEKSALIIDIGQWVLEQCCRQWHSWKENNLSTPKIAINVSARQLNHKSFLPRVHATLAEMGVSGEHLEFELTETAALSDIDDCIAKINAIRDLGISFAVDDFGSGHSSLTYLSQMPLDGVKVDRGFVENIRTDPTQAVITESLIKLASRLEIDIIAEGVEDAFTAKFLTKMGCRIMQGYYYSAPLSVDDVSRKLTPDKARVKLV